MSTMAFDCSICLLWVSQNISVDRSNLALSCSILFSHISIKELCMPVWSCTFSPFFTQDVEIGEKIFRILNLISLIIYIHTYTYTYIHIHTYSHTHYTHTHIYTYIHTYIHIYTAISRKVVGEKNIKVYSTRLKGGLGIHWNFAYWPKGSLQVCFFACGKSVFPLRGLYL